MTISRSAAAGAIVLNVPMIFAASILPVGAVALSVVLLAAIGAALGAVTAWAISTQPEPARRHCNAGRFNRRRAHRRRSHPAHPCSTSLEHLAEAPASAPTGRWASSCATMGADAACQTRLGPPPTLSGCAGSVRPRRMMSPSRSDYEAHNSGGPIPFLPELPWIDPHLLLVPGIGRLDGDWLPSPVRALACDSSFRIRRRRCRRRLRASRIRFGIRLLRAISRNSTAFRFGRRCPALRPREIARSSAPVSVSRTGERYLPAVMRPARD